MSVKPGTATHGARPQFTPGPTGGGGCAVGVGSPAGTDGLDDYLEQTVNVDYQSAVVCDGLVLFNAESFLIDRSPDFNGQIFDGNGLSYANVISSSGDTSSGTFGSDVRTYDGARAVESAIEVVADLTDGSVWGDCTTDGTVEILYCQGAGTPEIDVIYGSGAYDTGIAPACRAFSNTGTTEESLIDLPDVQTGIPSSTTILNGVPEVESKLVSFREDLCTLNGSATDFARARGLELWNAAVAAAHNAEANGDDRPLYWARLGMSQALTQWIPPFPADTLTAIQQLELASRGMLSANFTSPGTRVLISGFDPFALNTACGGSSILNGNPSGQAVLRLDGNGTLAGPNGVASAEVHAVIFPVNYADFDSGMVESFFQPYLDPSSPQLVNLVATVSQGGKPSQFSLEFYNGRNRSQGYVTDNNCATTAGSGQSPQPGGNLGPGPQFTESTLPVDAINSANPGLTTANYQVTEIRHESQGDVAWNSPNGPHVGSTAVTGGGGGYLSNEIAYRVTRLRDALNSPALAGHIHTPLPADDTQPVLAVAQALEPILATAVQSAPPIRVSVSSNQSVYTVSIGGPVPVPGPISQPALAFPPGPPPRWLLNVPSFSVTGPPNTPVYESNSQNGIEISAVEAYIGNTDSNGNLTFSWFLSLRNSDIGSWITQVRLNSVVATCSFRVVA